MTELNRRSADVFDSDPTYVDLAGSGTVSRLARSSGGVAFRRASTDGEIEVALIATRGGRRWQLPKGSLEDGETPIETAVREVREETGLITKPIQFLRTVQFWYWDTHQKDPPVRVCKVVSFYLLYMTGGYLNDDCHEVDGVSWFDLGRALDVLTFENERQVLQAASEALRQWPQLPHTDG